jgi:hydrogenase maturation protease
MRKKTLILGLGNVLMGDEGIGIKAVEYLQERGMAEEADLLDGGTGGFQLLSLFQSYRHIIIIDATIGGKEPGEISILKPRYASEFPRSLTSHDIGLKDLMQSAELLEDLPDISLIAINIADFSSVGIGISEGLEQRLPEIYQQVQEILFQIGNQ